MLIIRGVNVFPTQVESVLINIAGVLPHYLLIVDRVNATDTLEIQVEVANELFSDEVRKMEALTKRIEGELQSVLQLHANVKLVQQGHDRAQRGQVQARGRPPQDLIIWRLPACADSRTGRRCRMGGVDNEAGDNGSRTQRRRLCAAD